MWSVDKGQRRIAGLGRKLCEDKGSRSGDKKIIGIARKDVPSERTEGTETYGNKKDTMKEKENCNITPFV